MIESGLQPILTVCAGTLDPTPRVVTFSGLAGGPLTGRPPGHNSVTRVLPKDKVRSAYFLHCVQ